MEARHSQDPNQALYEFLRDDPTLVIRPDSDYGKLFELSYTPCCRALPVLFWFNSISRGVFVRIIVPPTGPPHDATELLSALNTLNYDLPVGTFTANVETGEVRYKNAVFVGDLELDDQILGNLAASAFETVRVCYGAIEQAVTGHKHSH